MDKFKNYYGCVGSACMSSTYLLVFYEILSYTFINYDVVMFAPAIVFIVLSAGIIVANWSYWASIKAYEYISDNIFKNRK